MKRPRKKQLNNQVTPIYRADGRVIGRVEGDTFHKSARSSVHMLTRPPAWACDVDALDAARVAGATWVELADRDTGATYRAALADFFRYGLKVTRGHGVQLALVLGRWSVNGGRPTVAGGGQPTAGGPVQPGLFEGVRG